MGNIGKIIFNGPPRIPEHIVSEVTVTQSENRCSMYNTRSATVPGILSTKEVHSVLFL